MWNPFDVQEIELIKFFADKRIRELTNSSIARRLPGTIQTAKGYNELSSTLSSDPRAAGLQVPPPVDIKQLFNPEANAHMWREDGLVSDHSPPPYLVDEDVRKGIAAMLVTHRVKEEAVRLLCETRSLARWMKVALSQIEITQRRCQGLPTKSLT